MAEAITDEVTQSAMDVEETGVPSTNLTESQTTISDIAKRLRDSAPNTNSQYLSQSNPQYGGDAILATNKETGETIMTNRSDLPMDKFDVRMRIAKPEVKKPQSEFADFARSEKPQVVDPADTEVGKQLAREALVKKAISQQFGGFDPEMADDPVKREKYVEHRLEQNAPELFKKVVGGGYRLRDAEYLPKDVKKVWDNAVLHEKAKYETDLDRFKKMVEEKQKGLMGHINKVLDQKAAADVRVQESKLKREEIQDEKDKVGFKSWTPEAKQSEFVLHMIMGKPPVNAAGMGGNDRQQYAKEYAQWKANNNFSPQDVALMQADYKAGDASLKNMKKQEAPMDAFVLNINRQIDKIQQLFNNNDRVGIRLLDKPLRDIAVLAKGSGEEAVKASYLLEISNEIGKLSSGASGSVQQLSDSAKEDWKKVHDVNLPLKEIIKIVNATRDQANMRISTWRQSKDAVRNEIGMLGTKKGEQRDISAGVNFLKAAGKDRASVIARIKQLSAQDKGWTREELNAIAKEAGW
jgi:hypothetical protein